MTEARLNATMWSSFRGRLARRLVTLKRDEFVEVHGASQRSHTALIFTLTGSGRIRCAVDGMALGPFWPPEEASVGLAQVATLDRLGWRQLRSGEYIRESGKRSLGELVSAVVDVLRQVWGVTDPSSLTFHDPFGLEAKKAPPQPDSPQEGIALPGTTTSVGIVPDDAQHLLELVRQVLSAIVGARVEIESNAVHFMTVDRVDTKCLVSPHAMRVELCTPVGHVTPDMALLGAVIAEHSSRWPDISMVVTKGHVFAVRALDCAVFHPLNFEAMLTSWVEFCSDGAIDIMEQFHPGSVSHYDPPPGKLPMRLAALLEEFTADPTTMTPAELVRRTKANTPLLRRYARICTAFLEDSTVATDADGELRRSVIEKFMPVLVAATSLAAQHNVAWEMPRGA